MSDVDIPAVKKLCVYLCIEWINLHSFMLFPKNFPEKLITT